MPSRPPHSADPAEAQKDTDAAAQVVVGQPRPYSDEDETPCTDPKTNEEKDLCQQWRMAEATEKLVGFAQHQNEITTNQFLATISEAILLGIAIIIASWAALEARRAAIATKRTADIASETAMRQLRAYLSFIKIETITLTEHLHEDRPRRVNGYGFRVTIENAGQTPALECAVCGSVSIMDAEGFSGPVFSKPQDTGLRTAIGPRSFVYGPLIGIDRDQAQSAREKKKRVFVCWWVDYQDVFEDSPKRFIDKIWEIEVTSNPDMLQAGEKLPSFHFRAYGSQNLN